MYPYQNHQQAHSVHQQQQSADLAHLLPQLQHLQPLGGVGQSSSFNSLATALIPATPHSPSLSQQQQASYFPHQQTQQQQQQQQLHAHGHHANQFMSQSFRHNEYQHAQQGTRNVDEHEMPSLDGWPISGAGPSSDQHFQHDVHGHGQPVTVTEMVYHNPKPTYPMLAQTQMMHDAASASDINAHSPYAQSLTSSSGSHSEGLFGYAQGQGETRAVSASVSESSGSTGLGMDTSAIVTAEERWPDPHGLLPLSVDVGSALGMGMSYGDGMQFGMSYNNGMGVGMEGMDGLGGMANVDLSMAYDMGMMGVPSGFGIESTFGMHVASEHGSQGLQVQMEYGTGVEYSAGSMEGSASVGQDGWVPVNPEDAMHLQQLQRPQSTSSSVGSGSGSGSTSSLAHANTYIPSPTETSGTTQGQEQGVESGSNSTYHSHGVQNITLQQQQQQQQHEASVQRSYDSHPDLVQAPSQQVAPAGFSSQQHREQNQVSGPQTQLQSQPRAPAQQQQPQPERTPGPIQAPAPPKLLPGQTGMLPPPDIPVRKKVGRPPMAGGRGGKSAKSAKSAKTYPIPSKSRHATGSGIGDGAFNTTASVVPPSVVNSNQGYVFPQVPRPQALLHQHSRTQSLPDLQQPLADLHHQQAGMQGYGRSPLAHRYSDEELKRGYEKAQAEREHQAKLRSDAEALQVQDHQQGQVQQGHSMAATVQTNVQISDSTADILPSPTSTHLEQNTSVSETASSANSASDAGTNVQQKVSFAHATTMMADGQWAIAQECNRAALTETFRLRHGRDPPRSMNILKTTALERSVPVERALMKEVRRETKEVEERNRRAREEAEAARRSWCGENADNLLEGDEEWRQNQEQTSSIDPEFWTNPLDESEWTPAQPGLWAQPSTTAPSWSGSSMEEARLQQQQQQLLSPISPNTPEEAVTPSDVLFPGNGVRASSSQVSFVPAPISSSVPSLIDEPTGSSSTSEFKQGNAPSDTTLLSTEVQTLPTEDGPLASRLRHIIRHDGHLPHHVSGLGGAFSEAYDGRSYLPDDAEPNPDNVPWNKPPGARMGDHPLLQDIRPHPLKLRGEKWHALADPNPDERFKTGVIKEEVDDEADAEVVSGTEVRQDGQQQQHLSMPVDRPDSSTENGSELKPLTRKDLEALEEPSEQGDGYGFPEGGSLGPGLGLRLPGLGDDAEGATGKRLKLSTEKKAPPKMACHFCRNRKIACGVGAGEDKTCNQCIRRGLRCVYPTESRRGMRVRKPRSAHTVDGVDEATKDGADEYEEEPMSPTAGSSSSKGKRSRKPKRGRGRPRRSRDQNNSTEDDEQGVDGTMDIEDPTSSDTRMDDDYLDSNNPLASLAAEARKQELQWVHQQPSDMDLNINISQAYEYDNCHGGSLPSHASSTALHGPIDVQATTSSGPFTTSPLHRRPGRPKKAARV